MPTVTRISPLFSLQQTSIPGSLRLMVCSVNLGNPYAAGGIEILEAAWGAAAGITVNAIESIVFNAVSAGGATQMVWNGGTKKVLAYVNSTGAEVGAIDISDAAHTCIAYVIFG
jgi:hypothetical protein